jgi:hypothetical protein
MYALKPPTPRSKAVRRSRAVTRPKSRKHRHPYRAIAFETGIKLAVNVAFSLAALSALVQLFPYQISQSAKLEELQVAVQSADERVQKIQSKFSYYFDPSQARRVMQEQTNRIDPRQRQIVWQESDPANPGAR